MEISNTQEEQLKKEKCPVHNQEYKWVHLYYNHEQPPKLYCDFCERKHECQDQKCEYLTFIMYKIQMEFEKQQLLHYDKDIQSLKNSIKVIEEQKQIYFTQFNSKFKLLEDILKKEDKKSSLASENIPQHSDKQYIIPSNTFHQQIQKENKNNSTKIEPQDSNNCQENSLKDKVKQEYQQNILGKRNYLQVQDNIQASQTNTIQQQQYQQPSVKKIQTKPLGSFNNYFSSNKQQKCELEQQYEEEEEQQQEEVEQSKSDSFINTYDQSDDSDFKDIQSSNSGVNRKKQQQSQTVLSYQSYQKYYDYLETLSKEEKEKNMLFQLENKKQRSQVDRFILMFFFLYMKKKERFIYDKIMSGYTGKMFKYMECTSMEQTGYLDRYMNQIIQQKQKQNQ